MEEIENAWKLVPFQELFFTYLIYPQWNEIVDKHTIR